MILYYALGGGLGHLTRSLALLNHAPRHLLEQCRLLASSRSAEIVRKHLPCPLDIVPAHAMENHSRYHSFFADYITQRNFSAIIVDSFPFGLLGELAWIATGLPRILVGRHLRWSEYVKICGSSGSLPWPEVSILIEEQPSEYLKELSRNSECLFFGGAVAISLPEPVESGRFSDRCCVVHSGSADEVSALMTKAEQVQMGLGVKSAPELFTPEHGLFPLERQLWRYSNVVTGAGYASCAAAVSLRGQTRFHQLPFERRYDNQYLRMDRLKNGEWGAIDSGAATARVAAALWETLAWC